MSQHSSLKFGSKDKQHRSVLSRAERIKKLKEEDKWQEGNSVFGLPKVKILRFKIKKEKAAPATEETAVTEEKPEEGKGETQQQKKGEAQQQKPVIQQKSEEEKTKKKK